MKNTKTKTQKPLIRLTFIVIPTAVAVIAALLLLYFNGFFMSAEEKLTGDWCRSRKGEYSGQAYKENYTFESDGRGTKTYIYPDGTTAERNFVWCITQNKTLVIDGKVKYKWNPNYEEYYQEGSTAAEKYWFVTKNNLYIGQSTSIKSEIYSPGNY